MENQQDPSWGSHGAKGCFAAVAQCGLHLGSGLSPERTGSCPDIFLEGIYQGNSIDSIDKSQENHRKFGWKTTVWCPISCVSDESIDFFWLGWHAWFSIKMARFANRHYKLMVGLGPGCDWFERGLYSICSETVPNYTVSLGMTECWLGTRRVSTCERHTYST